MKRKAVWSSCAALLFLTCLSQGCTSTKPAATEQRSISSSTGPINESDLGVPIYPNSTADQNQSFAFQGNSRSGNSVRTISASLTTKDSVSQVRDFYREKLGASAQIQEHQSGGGTMVDIAFLKPKEQVHIQVVPQASGQGSVIVILTQARS